MLWRFKRPNLAAKFATNRNVSLDKSKSFLQSVTHVAAGSAACSARRFRRQRHYVKGSPLDQTACSFFMFFVRRTSRRHSITAGFFALWLTLVYPTRKIKDFSRGDPGAACSTLLADQMRRLRYSVVLRTPYESRRERQSKRGRQLLLLLWRFKRPNLAAKFATNRNVSLDKSKSFLQSVTHVAAGSAACSARRFRRQRHYVKGSPLVQTVCSFFMFFVRRTSRRHSVFGIVRK